MRRPLSRRSSQSRNQRSAAQARAAAEAGLNHAVELATTYVFQWKDNGFDNPRAAIDALLWGPDGLTGTAETNADNTSLGARLGIDAATAIPLGTQLTIAGGINAEYEAFIMDDDADAPDEDGLPWNDSNETLIVRATGYAQDNTMVTLEARLAPLPLPAVAANGDLYLSGSVLINGATGRAHVNGDVQVQGSVQVIGTITATGAYSSASGDVSGNGGAAPLSLQEIRASDYLAHADFILTSTGTMTGTMTDPPGFVLCTWAEHHGCNNWDFNSGAGEWSFGGNNPVADGTYYVEGDVKISGSPGSQGNPAQVTIIAEGSIDISGSPDIIPDTLELLFVTDGDLEITGSVATHGPGQILVHEQIGLTGSPDLDVQIVVENATSVDDLVVVNSISGSTIITYDGGLDTGVLLVSGWRDVRP